MKIQVAGCKRRADKAGTWWSDKSRPVMGGEALEQRDAALDMCERLAGLLERLTGEGTVSVADVEEGRALLDEIRLDGPEAGLRAQMRGVLEKLGAPNLDDAMATFEPLIDAVERLEQKHG